jgi:hypothetical protein
MYWRKKPDQGRLAEMTSCECSRFGARAHVSGQNRARFQVIYQHEEAGKVLLAKDFQANYASLTTFGHFMRSHQFLSKGTSASESAKLCFLASEYAFFQHHFMALVTLCLNRKIGRPKMFPK